MNYSLLAASRSVRAGWIPFVAIVCVCWFGRASADQIPIQEIARDKPVDFATEIYPILKQNCLACHHEKEAEGGLNLETYELLVKGGDSGPGVIANKTDESQILARASGAEGDIMPPEDNSVGAKALTAEQLGLIQLWIRQGAPGGDISDTEKIAWQPIPESVRSTYAVDVSDDGRWFAASRGNRVHVYDLESGTQAATLADPSIQSISGAGVADVDLIQSIAFSPDGNRVATGGFRSVRIWKRSDPQRLRLPALEAASGVVVVNPDRSMIAIVNAVGDIELWSLQDNTRKSVLQGHSDLVMDMDWKANRLVSCDASGRIIAWDTSQSKKLLAHDTSVLTKRISLASSADILSIVDETGQVATWKIDLSDKENPKIVAANLAALASVKDATDVAFSVKPSPRFLVGTKSNRVFITGVDGKLIHNLDAAAPVAALAVSPDASKFAAANADGKIGVWQTADHKPVNTLDGSRASKLQLASAQRNAKRQAEAVKRLTAKTAELEKAVTKEDEAVKKLVEAGEKANKTLTDKAKVLTDATAKVTSTEQLIAKAKQEGEAAQKASEAAQKLVADSTKTFQILSTQLTAKKNELATANQQVKAAEKQFAAIQKKLADAKMIATKLAADINAQTKVVEAENQKIADGKKQIELTKKTITDAKTKQDKSTKELEAHKAAVTKAADEKKKAEAEVAKKNQALAAAKQAQQRAKLTVPAHKLLVEAATRRSNSLATRLASIQSNATGPANAARGVAFSPDGMSVATIHADGSARVYRAKTGLPVDSFDCNRLQHGVVFVSDNEFCAFGESTTTSGWAIRSTWALERTIGHHDDSVLSDRVTALDFRADGRAIAVGSGPPSRSGDVKVFAVSNGQLVRDFGEVHSDTVLGVRFSPEGRHIASSAADKTVRYLDIASGSVVRSFEGHTHHVLAVAWQDDQQTLASASADQNIKVWNAETGEQRRTISGFGKEITAIAFVQQTNQVASACADGNVRLHDTSNGRQIRAFSAGGDFLFSLSVSADGKTLVAGGQSGILRVWNVADGKLIREIK